MAPCRSSSYLRAARARRRVGRGPRRPALPCSRVRLCRLARPQRARGPRRAGQACRRGGCVNGVVPQVKKENKGSAEKPSEVIAREQQTIADTRHHPTGPHLFIKGSRRAPAIADGAAQRDELVAQARGRLPVAALALEHGRVRLRAAVLRAPAAARRWGAASAAVAAPLCRSTASHPAARPAKCMPCKKPEHSTIPTRSPTAVHVNRALQDQQGASRGGGGGPGRARACRASALPICSYMAMSCVAALEQGSSTVGPARPRPSSCRASAARPAANCAPARPRASAPLHELQGVTPRAGACGTTQLLGAVRAHWLEEQAASK